MGPGGFGVLVGSLGFDWPGRVLVVVVVPGRVIEGVGVSGEAEGGEVGESDGGVAGDGSDGGVAGDGSDEGVAGDGSDEGVIGDGSEGARSTRFSNSLGCSGQN